MASTNSNKDDRTSTKWIKGNLSLAHKEEFIDVPGYIGTNFATTKCDVEGEKFEDFKVKTTLFWMLVHKPTGCTITPHKYRKIRQRQLVQEFGAKLEALGDWETDDLDQLCSNLNCNDLEELREIVTDVYVKHIKSQIKY